MRSFNFLLSLAFLVIAFIFATAPATASTYERDDSAKSSTTQQSAATVNAAIVHVIVEQLAVANYAERVTATVERKSLAGDIVRIPEAPSFRIGHVPLGFT